jgi:DNA-binding NarL/FixJ family response regulator
VLVVDDFKPWHDFVSKTLRDEPELQVIANAYDGGEGVQQAQELQPDLILLDIGLPKLNGIEASRRIREVSPACKILFASENRSPDIVEQALRTGAGGYLVKSNAARELLPAIDAVLRGKRFVSACLKGQNSIDDADADRSEKVVAPSAPLSSDCHDLNLYTDDVGFVDGLGHFIETTLTNGNASVVIASESHRSDLLQKLAADGVDIDTAVEKSLLVFLDVDLLSTFKVDFPTNDNRPAESSRMPERVLKALRTAKERRFHVEVG